MGTMIRRGAAIVALTALFGVSVGLGSAAFARSFSDTGGTFFEEQIDKLTDAGCAAGFNDGSFRPRDATTRGQFALWLNNCGGRIAHKVDNIAAVFDNADLTLLSDSIVLDGDSGAGQTQIVRIEASVGLGTQAVAFADFCSSGLECFAGLQITSNAGNSLVQNMNWVNGGSSGREYRRLAVEVVLTVPTGTTLEYELHLSGTGVKAGSGEAQRPTMTATMFPFGAAGGATP